MPLQRGSFVRITIGTWSCKAMVVLASENGRSLMLMFDGAAPVGGGRALGSLPVLQEEDGTWIEILAGTPVEVVEES